MTKTRGGAARLRAAVVERALTGPGATSTARRRQAFDNQDTDDRTRALLDTVARHAWRVTDAQVEAARRAGASDDELFELVVCAALGQAARQMDAALAALDEAAPDGGGTEGA